MAKTVTEARQPDATAGTDAIYRSLFDSFNRDKDGRISPLEVVRYLLAVGADPQPVDRWGGTPLSDADGNGHTEIAALLRKHAEQAAPVCHRPDQREAAAV